MKNSSPISLKTDNLSVETGGARRATGVSTDSATQPGHFPDPEVTEKAVRRKFTAAYKLRILQEVEACTTQGQIGALLRREGLYSSNLTTHGVVNRRKALWKRFPQNSAAQRRKISLPPIVVLLNWKKKTVNLKRNSNRQKLLLTSKKTLGNTSDTTGPNRREDMMRAAESLAQHVRIKKACKALGIPRASYYYYQKCKKDLSCKRVSSTPPLALSEQEQQSVLDIFHSERF
ncbi:MAG: hypothetical protein UZ01_00509, partial [Candidatus Brocadia sinica]